MPTAGVPTNMHRRHFLRQVGVGAVGAWAATIVGVPSATGAPPIDFTHSERFGRMFHGLPPFAPATDRVREALMALGQPGGIMDANDDLNAGPVALIADPALSVGNRNSLHHSAGITFLGQFLDHDITFDMRSRLGFPTPPVLSPNARTPFFDLDSVYGGGPRATPDLYDPTDPIKFRVESGGQFEDLPRHAATNAALIGDPRNDENLVLAGLHLAFLLFHNRAVDLVRSQYTSIGDEHAFHQARRLTLWHYHWIILYEFLPAILGEAVVKDVLTNGRRFYNPLRDEAFIPVELQMAYRFGHSMVRPSYRANLKGDLGQPFFGMIFDPAGEGSPDPVDLRGGTRAPRRFIGWQTFFDFGGAFSADVRPNKRIDTTISTPLFRLPLGAIFGGAPPTSLMQRNLLRHLTWQVPSGQAIARKMRVPRLSAADLSELASVAPAFADSTPLLYYVLKEAELVEDGARLGPVGGRIVSEVFVTLLQTHRESFLRRQPRWVPTLPARGGAPESFRMIDFLTFAGVDPASRGQ